MNWFLRKLEQSWFPIVATLGVLALVSHVGALKGVADFLGVEDSTQRTLGTWNA